MRKPNALGNAATIAGLLALAGSADSPPEPLPDSRLLLNPRPPPPSRHPSHAIGGRRNIYCLCCGLWERAALREPCVGGPHPDSDLRFRQAVEKRARKAAKAVERATELRDRPAREAAAMDAAVERAVRSGVLR